MSGETGAVSATERLRDYYRLGAWEGYLPDQDAALGDRDRASRVRAAKRLLATVRAAGGSGWLSIARDSVYLYATGPTGTLKVRWSNHESINGDLSVYRGGRTPTKIILTCLGLEPRP